MRALLRVQLQLLHAPVQQLGDVDLVFRGAGQAVNPAEFFQYPARTPKPAQQLAVMIIAATEGAVALCRAERSREPFDVVDKALMQLVASES